MKDTIYNELTELFKSNNMNQDEFDKFHKLVCDKLINTSSKILTYGQAQKWINMTLKYVSMFDHVRTEKTYEFYHVPIDNIILHSTKYKKLGTRWSRISSYDKYFDFQKWFRNNNEGIPLDVEFNMWLNAKK